MKATCRNVLARGDESLRVFLLEEEEFPAAWHFHPQYELAYIISSHGIRYVGDNINTFAEGDFVLVGANLPHSWKTVCKQVHKVRAIVVQWNENMLGNGWIEKSEFKHISALFQLSSRGIKFPRSLAATLDGKMKSLLVLSPFEQILCLLEILNVLALQKDYVLLSSPNFKPDITSDDSGRINIIQSYVKNNLANKISVADVARQLGLNEGSFCRYFKKVYNKTFIAFLNEFRITFSCRLLIETDKTVSEVAYSSGFNSISLFHRLFNRQMNMTPLEYRKKYVSINQG
jgi:AraC-like DNA-binding protein